MAHALLSDLQLRADRRRLRTSDQLVQDLARAAWDRAQQERASGALEEARRWLERAHRLLPRDGFLALTFGSLLLELGEAQQAAPHLQNVAQASEVPEAWCALAACRLALGEVEAAARAVSQALRSSVPTDALAALADRVVEQGGAPGWCGLRSDGSVRMGRNRPSRVTVDGTAVRGRRLPPGLRSAAMLEAEGRGGPFLGSPIPIGRIVALEGFVEARRGGIEGWAWCPADSERDPLILLRGPQLATMLTAKEPAEHVGDLRPLARPRRFSLSPGLVKALGGGPISVTDETGRHLLGSPLHPGIERSDSFVPVWTDAAPGTPAVGSAQRQADVVIPVYRGAKETLACIESVLGSVPPGTVVYVVEDASPDRGLVEALEGEECAGRIRLIRQPVNRGFPAAANAGMRAASGRDVVLLNSDTLVAPGWLERLRRAAYSAPDIGTATPLSNDATILSYPDPAGGNPIPDLAETIILDEIAQTANRRQVAEVPVGVGFCLYVRRDCLDQAGLFREDLFAQGYGEENDFCLRARQHGWRHVAALDVFVSHVGACSFGSARAHLLRRNGAILNRLHPGYDALIADHVAADPLLAARRRMDAVRWREGRSRKGAALLITHAEGGGVEEVIGSRCAALREQGLRPIVLRPDGRGCRLETPGACFPNLRYAIPSELPELAALLRRDRPRHLELHHLLGHDHAVLELARMLELPVETWVHDYAAFCPRIALVGRERRYCGEPGPGECENCVADLGEMLEERIGVPDLLARSRADFGASRTIVAPSFDTAQRLRRHFPGLTPVVSPWEDDSFLPPIDPVRPGPILRVCVPGAIGVEKGYDVLLACARDAAERALPIEFVVCGFTADDERLLACGNVFITGRYREHEAVPLIRSQRAHVALIPSVWPETWCFALSRAWQAGLFAFAFDLGAQAERIRATGRGRILPLGVSSRGLNDALLGHPGRRLDS